MFAANTVLSDKQALFVRLFVGAVFGLMIATLLEFDGGLRDQAKPIVWREVLIATLALTAFPIWAGAGTMRRISLGIWAAVVFVVIGGICWFNRVGSGISFDPGVQVLLVFPLLFIAHELVSSGDLAGKVVAPYEAYFDEAWKRGVQLALALLFSALFWGILALGAALLGFIGFDWLKDLLVKPFFWWPVSGLAFGAAVHLGDVQTKLLANVRSLILGVLSWLLPVITLIGAIFAGSLLSSGLAPLWATKAATATLLAACVGFVLLINAAYQQGDVERPVSVILKWCVRVAAILLLIFACLAAWSLGLRIGQYGLSPERVFAGLGVLIALAYGIGYGIAVFVPGRWMAALEPINIGLAALNCAFFFALLTPIATPNRISVNDQVARLQSGKVSVADFDWWLLKDETGEYGKKALKTLETSTNPQIATKAKAALKNEIGERPVRERDVDDEQGSPVRTTPADIAKVPVVFPGKINLPETFTNTNFNSGFDGFSPPACLRFQPPSGQSVSCKAALLDLNQDGVAEILIREGPSLFVFAWQEGKWTLNTGFIDIGSHEADFDAGRLKIVPPKWSDVMVGQRRVQINDLSLPEIARETGQETTKEVPAIKEPPTPSK